MSEKWPTVELGEVIRQRKEFISLDDTIMYKRPRVKTNAGGIVLRDEIPGSLIKTKKQQVCNANELLVAEIDAKVGGYGIVPPELSGSIVSSHYFLFSIDGQTLLHRFLDWFCKTKIFRDQVNAQGTTNYAAIRPTDVLSYKIPLPPLDEQRRIVSRIETLVGKMEEAQKLREQSIFELDSLCRSMIWTCKTGCNIPLRELVRYRETDVDVQKTGNYKFAGVYCFGRGVFVGQERTGSEFAYPKLTRLRAGDFVYPKLMAWEGAFGIVPSECDGCVVSPEFPVFELDQSRIMPEVMDVYFKSPAVWPEIAGISTGTNVRRRRLNPKAFLNHHFPLPDMKTQHQIKRIHSRFVGIKNLSSSNTKTMEEFIPSLLDKAFKGEL